MYIQRPSYFSKFQYLSEKTTARTDGARFAELNRALHSLCHHMNTMRVGKMGKSFRTPSFSAPATYHKSTS